MKITVIHSDRQRRLFEVDSEASVVQLVTLVHAVESMEGKALFFQGKQLNENGITLQMSGIPAEGGIVRVDEAEDPVSSRAVVEVIEEDEETEMQRMLGFGSFSTSKGASHANISGAKVVKKVKHRQYMNRKGGKEKPLASDT